jgi:hypothetical protein
MHAPIVIQKARHAFGCCEASRKVDWDDIFEGESGVVLSDFIEWRELEESEYLTMPADVEKEPPEFARSRGGRPGALVTHKEECPPKELEPLREFTLHDQAFLRRNARILEVYLEKGFEETLREQVLHLTDWD